MITADDNLLAGLDEVDWANLNHAYGTADDVPGQLRALCGDDEQAQQEAVAGLFNHLAHQGTRCQASPHAVPFRRRRTRCRCRGPAPVPATDYNQGDFHGHIADTLLALPPSPTSRAAVAACLPSINPSQRAFKAKAVLPDLFPSPCPTRGPRTRACPAPSSSSCTPSPT